MNKDKLCFYKNSKDSDYVKVWNHDLIKKHLQELWGIYKPYADYDFEKKLSEDFWPRVWEMSLAVALKESNANIILNKTIKGPDLIIKDNNIIINIEAVCPTPGETGKPDSVTKNVLDLDEVKKTGNYAVVFEEVPFEKIELRLSSVLRDKNEKIKKYLNDNIIKDTDINILAISAVRLPWTKFTFGDSSGIEKNILRTVLPIGSEVITVENLKKRNLTTNLEFKESNTKNNGEPINKNIFNNPDYNNISAIIYTIDEFPILNSSQKRHIYLIKNPNCKNELTGDFNLEEIIVEVGDSFCRYYKKNYH